MRSGRRGGRPVSHVRSLERGHAKGKVVVTFEPAVGAETTGRRPGARRRNSIERAHCYAASRMSQLRKSSSAGANLQFSPHSRTRRTAERKLEKDFRARTSSSIRVFLLRPHQWALDAAKAPALDRPLGLFRRCRARRHRSPPAQAHPSLHRPENWPSMPAPSPAPSRVRVSMCRRRSR